MVSRVGVVVIALGVSLPIDAVLTQTIVWCGRIGGIASAVNAAELLTLAPVLSARGVWRDDTLSASWGVLRVALRARAFGTAMLLQLLLGLGLTAFAGTKVGGFCAVGCTLTTVLAAMRFRGTVNGGSDGMLFTVLTGLSLAQLAPPGSRLGEAAMLYVAAQLTLSYVRAGLVKVRQPGWWNGASMGAFLALPAYGVPAWIPRDRVILQGVGMVVVLWECLAPVAWLSPRLSLLYIGIALAFHAGVALTFGLNRFVLAWGAALPTLWYVAHRLG